MAAFQGYARSNGFSPIQVPDTSARDLAQADRELKGMQRAYEAQTKYARAFQSQTQANQQIEADNRKQNFELNDKFIKQNREADKRNFETQIKNAERQEDAANSFKGFAMQLSKTAAYKYSEQMEAKREAEKDFAMGLIYKYGVTSEERAEIDAIEGEISDMQGVTSPAVQRLRAQGASTVELKTLANLSGYAELGANIGIAQNAGNNYAAYVGADRKKYKVGDEMMTMAQAYSEGDLVAVKTIQDQQRINYINEATPGMSPMFLDKHMFPKMRAVEAQTMQQVAAISRQKFDEQQKLLQQQEMMVFVNSQYGASDLFASTQVSNTQDQMPMLRSKISLLSNMLKAGIPGTENLADNLMTEIVSSRRTGQKGEFQELYPILAAQLQAARDDFGKQDRARRKAKLQVIDLNNEELYNSIKDIVTDNGTKDPNKEELEAVLNNPETPIAVKAKLSNLLNYTATAQATKQFNAEMERKTALGIPVDRDEVLGAKNVDPVVKNKWLGQLERTISQEEDANLQKYVAATLLPITQFNEVADLEGDASALSVKRELVNGARRVYADALRDNLSVSQAYNAATKFVNEELKDPKYQYRSRGDDPKQPEGFVNFMNPNVNVEMGRVPEINSNPTLLSEQSFIDKETLQSIADSYERYGDLSRANLDDIYRLADELPKVSYLDLLQKQMDVAGIKFDYQDPSDSIDQADPDSLDALRRLNYKSNPTQSAIASVGLGNEPDINTDLNSVQQQATQIIADVESGPWGYNAVNQGTAPDGTILGSGSIDNIYPGMDLTEQTLGQVRALQNETFPGSDDEWRASGGLWAVGKYQFIPKTLQMLIDKNNISLDTKFSPALQDYLALQLLTIQGPQAWIGVMENGRVKISQAKFNILQRAAQMQMPDFGPAKWRQPDTLDPLVVEAYLNGSN